MKIEITNKPVEELESSSVTRGQARRSARKTRRSGTKGNTTTRSPNATRRPAAEKKVGKKPASKSPSKPKAPQAGSKTAQQKQKKAHKVPNSVELLVQKSKPKLRVKISEPGRYVLAGRGVQYALVRVKEETKYTPSIGQKMFSPKGLESNSSDGDSPDWDVIGLDEIVSESIADLEVEYEMELDAYVYDNELDLESDSARAPGAKNNQAGNKLGRKKRAANMMAPGWHMLKKGTDGKITKQYVGPRMSARRLIDIAGGGDAKKEDKKPTDKPQKATELDRKVASGFRKELNERDMKDAKVQRSTKDGSMKITIDKGDRTKLTGALSRLKKQMEGKLEITREIKGDKVVATIKLAGTKAPEKGKAKAPTKGTRSASKKETQVKSREDFNKLGNQMLTLQKDLRNSESAKKADSIRSNVYKIEEALKKLESRLKAAKTEASKKKTQKAIKEMKAELKATKAESKKADAEFNKEKKAIDSQLNKLHALRKKHMSKYKQSSSA